MKAIVPVAGAGTKLRPHTYTQPKALIPVAGKPILQYIIDQLIEAGINDYVFVIGYLGDKIKDFVQTTYPDLNAAYIEQENREGIGHALYLTKDVVKKNEELLIVLGDCVFDIELKEVLAIPHSVLGVKKVEDPRQFGVAETDADDFITRVVEKPLIPKSNLALVGLYKIKESAALFTALNYLLENNIQTKEEFQLTDALMHMIEEGIRFKSYKVNNWFDCGKKESLLETNATLLKKQTQETVPSFENTIIIPPVNIGQHCKITNSIIGPHVTVGEHAHIHGSILRNSIIGSYSDLNDVVLNESIIGNDANVRGKSNSLNIGDNAELDLR